MTHLPTDLSWRREYSNNGLPTVFLLVPSGPVTWDKICETFAEHIDEPGLPRCFNAIVPRYAPLSAEQAILWSERYWPTSYNPASQLLQDAPPLHQLRRVQTEIDTISAIEYIQIARIAAAETSHSGLGRCTGAVVVNPKTQQIVAVAGDARWWTDEKTQDYNQTFEGEGRPEHHALMRVVAMVANKELRRRLQAGTHARFASTCTESPAGQSLTDIENVYADSVTDPMSPSSTPRSPLSPTMPDSPRKGDSISITGLTARLEPLAVSAPPPRAEGYLCSGLDIYLTHEPCVCCAMAMIHSRFRSCVFEERMPGSGALTARDYRDSLSYGLFWRRELNWRVMTFKYGKEMDRHQQKLIGETFHA